MPIKTQNDLPVKEILERENIFVMDENRASHQNIRQLDHIYSRGHSHITQSSEQILRDL